MRSLPSPVSGTSFGVYPASHFSRLGLIKLIFYSKLKKVKKANGEIIGVNTVRTTLFTRFYPLQPMQEAGGIGLLTGRLCCVRILDP